MPKATDVYATPRSPSTKSATATVLATRGVEVVYYVRLAADCIKIGTTRNLLTRCRSNGLPGRGAVLAYEYGGRDLERTRHLQFAHLRIGRSEQFRTGRDLIAHVRALRATQTGHHLSC